MHMSIINISEIEKKSQETYERVKYDINLLLTHRAFPDVFSNLFVDGTKLMTIASISNFSSTIVNIKPFDKSNLKIIEDVVRKVPGYTTSVRGEIIYLEIMPLYKDVIVEKIKQANGAKEGALVKLRQMRQDALNLIKKNKGGISENIIKKQEQDIQKVIDQYTKSIKDIPTNL